MRIPSSLTTIVHTHPANAAAAATTPFSQLVSRAPAGETPIRARALKSSVTSATLGSPQSSASSTSATSASADTSGAQSSLDQSEDENMQFLQLQSQMNAQSETFTTLSNVMKTENDTIKNTAGNMQI